MTDSPSSTSAQDRDIARAIKPALRTCSPPGTLIERGEHDNSIS